MSTHREVIRDAAITLLNAAGDVHAARHQESYARRYTIRAPGGIGLDIMYQQTADILVHLWVLTTAVSPLIGGPIAQEPYPAAVLWTEVSKKTGEKIYGRHSALLTMSQLCNADLTRFTPASPAEVEEILDQLIAASAAGGV